MSLPIEKLSLLDSLTPLRYTADMSGRMQESGFGETLDKALGGELVPAAASEKAREMAETLTIQMLHSSLMISGDASSESGNTVLSTPFSSLDAFLKAYRDNLAEEIPPATPSVSTASSAREGGEPGRVAVEAIKTHEASHSVPDTAWLNPVILRAAQKYGVDAGLIRAVIKAESDFNPQAVSHAGARGLMQLMPSTARSLGVIDSFDPEQNVMAGTRFLKDLLQRYGGDVDSALAAYNWGPGNVDRRPDQLPRETRTYLARVKELYASYSS
jgi:soluble lytic murein transglycosylase-like protein